MKHLPNALTLLRLALAPVVAWLIWTGAGGAPVVSQSGPERAVALAQIWTWAAGLFSLAALTDLFDGMAARAFNAHSKFGRVIDPIADKLLVGLPLIALSVCAALAGSMWPLIAAPTAIIVVRDVLVTFARLKAPDGEGAPVSSLAKIKTALELVVVGAVLVGLAAEAWMAAARPGQRVGLPLAEWLVVLWIALLMLAAGLSAYTGYRYLVHPTRAAK